MSTTTTDPLLPPRNTMNENSVGDGISDDNGIAIVHSNSIACMANSKDKYKLANTWNLYYHLPQCKKWDLESYKTVMRKINNAVDVIALNETLDPKLIKYCMLFLMKDGITPMWEDKKNRNGGCFSYKVPNKQVVEVWKSLFYSVCGETLCVNKKHSELINGITISPKKNFCIIKVWLLDCTLQDPNLLIDIPNLLKQGCLFKKHEPEF